MLALSIVLKALAMTDTVALSYDSLAERLGISVPSARRLVQRRNWRKGPDTQGRAVVQVPAEFLQARDSRKDSPRDRREDDARETAATVAPASPAPSLTTDLMARLATLQGEHAEIACGRAISRQVNSVRQPKQ